MGSSGNQVESVRTAFKTFTILIHALENYLKLRGTLKYGSIAPPLEKIVVLLEKYERNNQAHRHFDGAGMTDSTSRSYGKQPLEVFNET